MKLHEIKKYKTELAEEQAWKLIQKHCSDAMSHLQQPIVRGMKETETGVALMHGAAGERSSRYAGSNFYTIILDAVLAPLGFPKRSASLIAANWNNRGHAGGYGTKHAIIPFNGVKIGVCPGEDIFETKISFSGQTQEIFRWNRTFKMYGLSDKSISDFLSSTKDKFEHDMKTNKYFADEKWMKDIAEKGIDALKSEYQKPFTLTTTAEPTYNDGLHELWIGGKCVAIELGLYKSMIKNYKVDDEN